MECDVNVPVSETRSSKRQEVCVQKITAEGRAGDVRRTDC